MEAPALSKTPERRGRRRWLTTAILLVLLFSTPGLVNLLMNWWQRTHSPAPGQWYLVEGRKMHLYCTGKGSPTIVIAAGSGGDWLGSQTIQAGLSQWTSVCSYDRSGLGWSEPRQGPHDAEAIARQLHELLDNAGVQRPLLLVGASAGGFYVREYAREFPIEVAGVAFLDASSPNQLDELPGSRAWYDAGRRDRPREVRWQKLKVWLGWERLRGRCHDTPEPGLEKLMPYYEAEMCRPEYEGADLEEWMDFERAGQQAARLTSFGNVPLVVISQDPDRPKTGWTEQAIAAQPIWAKEQEALKSLSPKSWHVVAKGSRHHVQGDRPDIVLGEIKRMLDYLHGGPEPPFGTTTKQ